MSILNMSNICWLHFPPGSQLCVGVVVRSKVVMGIPLLGNVLTLQCCTFWICQSWTCDGSLVGLFLIARSRVQESFRLIIADFGIRVMGNIRNCQFCAFGLKSCCIWMKLTAWEGTPPWLSRVAVLGKSEKILNTSAIFPLMYLYPFQATENMFCVPSYVSAW